MDLPTTPVVAPKPRGTNALSIILAIAVAVAIGGVAFAAGRLTAPVAAVTAGIQTGLGNGNGHFGGNFPDGPLAGVSSSNVGSFFIVPAGGWMAARNLPWQEPSDGTH